jgi:ADP-heptose:LPS heptosyltransferase
MKRKTQKDFGLLRLFQDLKQLHIDAFADLHNVLRSKVVRTFFGDRKKK